MKKVILMLLLTLCVALSGCQKAAESDVDSAKVTRNSPFNTAENGAWGDESSFLRIADLTNKTDELLIDDFSSGSFTLNDERDYVVAVYLHDTSDEAQQDVTITLNYADVLHAGKKNRMEVLLGWSGEDAGFMSDALELEPATDLELWPTDNDGDISMAIIRRSDGELTKTPLISANLDETTTQMVMLDEVSSGEYYIIFFMFESLSVPK